jgi:uncharacterized sulfatase
LETKRIEVEPVIENTTREHFVNWLEAIKANDQSKCNNPPDLGAAAMVVVNLGAKSYREGKVFHFDPECGVYMEGNPSWAKKWENMSRELIQDEMQQYFGMVKCIDDNVGHLLNYLKEAGLDRNTIVVFTADHGDLMGEHNRHEKGLPYEASAKIPFIIRYPGRIPAGKVIRKAYTNVDFMPTVLGLMGVPEVDGTQGLDDSKAFLSRAKEVVDDRIVYFTKAGGSWVSVANYRYKLVLSREDKPWLFDLERDPDELINFYQDPEYKAIGTKFMKGLKDRMELYNEGKLSESKALLQFQ